MPPFIVWLNCHEPAKLGTVVERLRALGTLPDGEFVDDEHGMRFEFEDKKSETLALIRAETLVQGALQGTGIDPAIVGRSFDGEWSR